MIPNIVLSQTFVQNFNSSTSLSDYFNSTPITNQFDKIDATGDGVIVSVANNNLSFTRATTNTGLFSRVTDFNPSPTGITIKFDLTISGNTTAQTSAAIFYIGSGFTSTSTVPTNSRCFARFSINFTATNGTFQIKDISNTGSNTSSDLSGTQTIRWILNNTGASANYTSPTGSTESLENDKADIWANTIKLFNDVSVETTTEILTDFKFLYSQGTGTITFDNFEIGFSNDGALPVQLKSFTAQQLNGNVILNWSTVTEINNSGFEIEKLVGKRWSKIGFISGKGTSNIEQNYSFRDMRVLNGRYEYRLKQIDLDGKYEYTKSVQVQVGKSRTRLTLNPNPFNPTTRISYYIPEKTEIEIKFYDLLGKEVAIIQNKELKEEGEYEVTFNSTTNNLTSGVYFCILKTSQDIITEKIVLMK
ncbi:MAG: T9SS type A sorting domain-containing protein [Bacteroidetes bacterium]|nr:T9SS type A sorting domain-containing protein [Bacteroidota bacterium]